MNTYITAMVASVWASIGATVAGFIIASDQGGVNSVAAALWGLGVAFALGAVALARKTIKAMADPFQQNLPRIAGALSTRRVNKWLVRAGLEPIPIPGAAKDNDAVLPESDGEKVVEAGGEP